MRFNELLPILTTAVTEGAEKTLLSAGNQSEHLPKTEAYRRYGRSNVDRWLMEGLLKTSEKFIVRSTLEAVAASSNRKTYLPVAGR